MYQIVRSDRKSIALQLRPDGSLVVRAPRRATDREIEAVVEKHRDWIQRARLRAAASAPAPEERFTQAELHEMGQRLLALLPERLERFAPLVGVSYGRVTVRNQKTRWGSCSSRGNLNFNCLLALAPPEVLDYVVVHELCHRKHMDHSPAFWGELRRVMPEYESRRAWLKTQGTVLMRRMTG